MTKPQTNLQETANESFQDEYNVPFPDLSLLAANLSGFPVDDTPLNANERMAVTDAVNYVAYTQNVSEETVSALLAIAFGVGEVEAMPSRYYDEAIRFLVDLRLGEAAN
jgi:hypothetical protein